MAARDDEASEILLGNKQLLGVFAVVALLLAVAFTGGYMLGKSSVNKKSATDVSADSAPPSMTKVVVPEDTTPKTDAVADPPKADSVAPPKPSVAESKHEPLLGAPKTATEKASAIAEGTPKPNQTFLQVGALTHTQAEAMAVVLRKQNFRARIAPRPGSTVLFRVLVGPVRDAGDLSSTRDALRKIGFRDVIVQRY